jgi:nuclear transport factor 2 (NTF2) superfamily protein
MNKLIITPFDVKKIVTKIKMEESAKQYDQWEKVKFCIAYIFDQCKKNERQYGICLEE